MDSVDSPPGSSVHGISQARILEWVAISFSRGSFTPKNQICISCCRQILYCWATEEAHMYTYIPSVFSFLSHLGTSKHWVKFPVLYSSRLLLVSYFIHNINSEYVSILTPQCIQPFLLPLGVICLFSLFVSLFLLCKQVHLYGPNFNISYFHKLSYTGHVKQ